MKAIFLLATLKTTASGEYSHTEALSMVLVEELKKLGCESEFVRLVDHNIPVGLKSDMGAGDEWPTILPKITSADIVIFATPIWWGGHSSLMQRVIERMDALNDELIEKGTSGLLGKVGGMVITGEEDGAEHVIGNLANFLIWNGMTLPPAVTLSYLGGYENTEAATVDKFKKQESTAGMAKTMAQNLVHMATLLKNNPYPDQEKNSQYIR